MTAATPAQRQAALKARRIAAGLVMVKLWCHPDDTAPIQAHAQRLAKARAKQTGPGAPAVKR